MLTDHHLTKDEALRLECARITGSDGASHAANARALYAFVTEGAAKTPLERIAAIIREAGAS